MNLYKISKIVTISAVAILLIWDTIAQLAGGLESTVSWAIWEWSNDYAFVSFAVGFVMGHLFFGKNRDLVRKETQCDE